MSTERTPEELRDDEQDRARAQTAVAAATESYASWLIAEREDMPAEVCERWVDRIWGDLRIALDPEDRLTAILMLIRPEAERLADRLTTGGAS